MNRIAIVALTATIFCPPLFAQTLLVDLEAVPDTAVGFIHVRVADLWKYDLFGNLRAVVEKAGATNVKLLDEHFVPAPSTIDRVTLIFSVNPSNSEPEVLFVLATRTPFDHDKLFKESLTRAVERKSGNESYYYDEAMKVAVHAPTPTLVVFGPEDAMKEFLAQRGKGHRLLGPALEAAGRYSITGAVNLAGVPNDKLLNDVPPAVQPLLKQCLLQVSADLGSKPALYVRLQYPDSAAATDAEKAVKDGLESFRQMLANVQKAAEEGLVNQKPDERSALRDLPQAAAILMSLAATNRAISALNDFSFKRAENALTSIMEISPQDMKVVASMGGAIGLLLPAVQKVREAAARTKDANNLKQIGLALHNYASVNGTLPAAAIRDKDGKPLLSWRVAILPYIEQQNLYQQFHLDEPWDSAHNIKLAETIPSVYIRPNDAPKRGTPTTRYLALVGNGAGWELNGGLRLESSFPDGLSNTIWIVESTKAVPWTKPEDIEYDPKKMPPLDFTWSGQYSQVAFVDGSVRALSKRVPEKTWHLLIQRADGQPIPREDLDK